MYVFCPVQAPYDVFKVISSIGSADENKLAEGNYTVLCVLYCGVLVLQMMITYCRPSLNIFDIVMSGLFIVYTRCETNTRLLLLLLVYV